MTPRRSSWRLTAAAASEAARRRGGDRGLRGVAPLLALIPVVVAAALGGTAYAADAQAGARLLSIGRAPALTDATVTGAVAPSTVLKAEVILAPRDPAALAALATAVSTPGSPQFHQYLAPGEFGLDFGATPATVTAVDAALLSAGLQPGPVSSDGLAIPVTTSAAALEGGLHVHLLHVRLADGRSGYTNDAAPQLPASVAGAVQTVIGLSDLATPSPIGADSGPLRAPPSSDAADATDAAATTGVGALSGVGSSTALNGAPAPCAAASAAAGSQGHTIDQIAYAYGATELYGAGDLGSAPYTPPAPVTVAVYELESAPNLTTDLAGFQQCFGTSAHVTTQVVDTGGSANPPYQGVETMIDTENVIGLAPQANVIVYQGPNDDTGPYDTYSAIITQDVARIMTTSWGVCEPDMQSAAPQDLASENTLFQEAAAQGQTIVAASGDDGSSDCGNTVTPELAVDDPGSQPFVTDVGGTTLRTIAPPPSEIVWNRAGSGAGGGGISTIWSMPSYQSSSTAPGIVEPGVSSGAPCHATAGVLCREVPDVSADGDPNTGYSIYWNGSWGLWGGTSGAAPVWAGLMALVDAQPACSASSLVGFINPRLYAIAGGASATYALHDVVTGNNDTTGVLGEYNAGTGFDMASGLGTPDLGAEFDSGLAGQLCQLPAPAVTSVSPASGSTSGGQTVTVHGSGFTPQSTVTFGGVAAPSVTVSNATTLTAVTPAGSGLVAVVVSTAAGNSPSSGTSAYAYGTATTTSTSTSTSTTTDTITSTATSDTSTTSSAAPTSSSTASTSSSTSSATTSSSSATTSSSSTTTSSSGSSSTATGSGGGGTGQQGGGSSGSNNGGGSSGAGAGKTGSPGTAAMAAPTLRIALHQHGYSIAVGSAFCPQACTVATHATAQLLVNQSHGGHTSITIKAVALGTAKATIKQGLTRSLSLLLSTSAARLLRSQRHITATISVTLVSTAGHRAGSAQLALVMPRGH